MISDLGDYTEGMAVEAVQEGAGTAEDSGTTAEMTDVEEADAAGIRMKQETVPMSNLYEYIKMAVHNIMANKGRSFLTMLGIIIGIASVIAIVFCG